MSAVPTGLGVKCWLRQPTLKRGANNHCACGAGRQASVSMEHSGKGPFEGPPTLKSL